MFSRVGTNLSIGYSWSDQGEIDAYYRVQLTPEIQIGPTFQVIFDPVRNQDKDTVYIWGIRTRIAL